MDLHVQLEHSIRNALDSKKTCLVVIIDLSSAFDKIWHERLIGKLIEKGIKGNLLAWLHNYLLNRKMFVRINGRYSEETDLNSGTPQGAVLSPLLFNLMLSDIPNDVYV